MIPAWKSLREHPSPLSTAFFSTANLDRVQAGLVEEVRRTTGLPVTRQSDTQMGIIMLYVYRESGAQPMPVGVEAQVGVLNAKAIALAAPVVAAGAKHHLAYLRDRETPLDILPRGTLSSTRGTGPLLLK